ncbi:hypothetical protein HY388_00755 [Candidatus Daviesbacteria bacterium]|nr:hypothetical protein [Candidatus Daviesbacteria bacterium]
MTVFQKNAAIGLFLLSLFYHLLILLNSQITFFSDDAIYATIAQYAISGHWDRVIHPFWPPFYPLLSGVAYYFLGNWENSLRIISVASAIFSIIPIVYLAAKTMSFWHGYLLGIFLSVSSPLLGLSLLPLSDPLAALFITWALVLIFFAFANQRPILFVTASASLGLAYLTRSEGMMFFILSLAGLLIVSAWQFFSKQQAWRLISLNVLGLTIPFLLIIAPYVLAVSHQMQQLSFSAKLSAQVQMGHAFQIRDNGRVWAQEIWSVEPNYSSEYFHGGQDFLLENIDYFWWWAGQKISSLVVLLNQYFSPAFGVMVALAILTTLTLRCFVISHLVLLLTLFSAAATTAFFTPIIEARYLLWLFPFVSFYIVLGIHNLSAMLTGRNSPKIGIVLSAIILALLPVMDWHNILNPISQVAAKVEKERYHPEISDAAWWIRQQSFANTPIVMMRHENVAYYSGSKLVYLPQVDLEQAVNYAKRHHVNFIIAWNAEIEGDPKLSVLLDPQQVEGSLKLEKSWDYPTGKVRIYSIN